MRQIIFGFSKPKSTKPFASAIMWWDKKRFGADIPMSHGYVKFVSDRWEVGFIYQNAKAQTHFMGQTHFESINDVVEEYSIPVSDEVEAMIGKMCVEREGKKYAIKQVVGIAVTGVVWLITAGKVQLKNPWADGDDQTTCIEEQAAVLSEGLGVKYPEDLDLLSVWPFRNFVKSLPSERKVK